MRTDRFRLIARLSLALLFPLSSSADANPFCADFLLSEQRAIERAFFAPANSASLAPLTAISDLYAAFSHHVEKGEAAFHSLSVAERDAIYELSTAYGEVDRFSGVAALDSRVDRITELSIAERARVKKILGLDQATLADARDAFRKRFEYLFWSDHSRNHVREVLTVSKNLRKRAPSAFRKHFESLFGSAEWSRRIEWALRIHDSRMSTTRARHAEALLEWADATFPDEVGEAEKALTSVLAMLHSKSAVSYADLTRWADQLDSVVLPRLVTDGLLSEDKASVIRKTIRALSAQDRLRMRQAATWLRIADAMRPIGADLRNSLGYPFVLGPDSRSVFLRMPSGDVPVPPSQIGVAYGQVALENPVLQDGPDGTLDLVFSLRLKGSVREAVFTELIDVDFIRLLQEGNLKSDLASRRLSREARAVAGALGAILGDFPPELLEKSRLVLR